MIAEFPDRLLAGIGEKERAAVAIMDLIEGMGDIYKVIAFDNGERIIFAGQAKAEASAGSLGADPGGEEGN
jgi:hypothetical protein